MQFSKDISTGVLAQKSGSSGPKKFAERYLKANQYPYVFPKLHLGSDIPQVKELLPEHSRMAHWFPVETLTSPPISVAYRNIL